MLNGTNAVLLQTILYLTANTNQPNDTVLNSGIIDIEANSVYNDKHDGKLLQKSR